MVAFATWRARTTVVCAHMANRACWVYYSTRAKLDQKAQDAYLRNLGELMQEKAS